MNTNADMTPASPVHLSPAKSATVDCEFLVRKFQRARVARGKIWMCQSEAKPTEKQANTGVTYPSPGHKQLI